MTYQQQKQIAAFFLGVLVVLLLGSIDNALAPDWESTAKDCVATLQECTTDYRSAVDSFDLLEQSRSLRHSL